MAHWVVLNKNGTVSIRDKAGLELESHNIVIGSVISVKDGEDVKKGDTVVTWDPYNVPILTEKDGKVEFRDMISGITVTNETDKETGKKGMVVTEHKEDLHPQVVIIDEKTKEVKASYSIPVGAHLSVKEGADRHRRHPARQDSAQSRPHQGHHRWSAPGGRAFRSPQAQGLLRHRQDRRRRLLRRQRPRQEAASSSPTPKPASRSTTWSRWASTSSSPMATS